MNNLEKQLIEEVARFNAINKYTTKLMNEQGVPVEDPAAIEPPVEGGELPPPPADMGAPDAEMPTDAPIPTDVPAEGGDTEEIDITDLVNMTKSIKQDLDDSKSENEGVVSKMDDVFSKLSDLEQKLAQMDAVMSKIDELGNKVETMREKTPEEKLEMRSFDSYPFNQNPQQFFAQKQGEMRQSGKNEYVLTKQDIDTYSPQTIKNTFNPEQQEDDFKF
jgi:hypothetical protein